MSGPGAGGPAPLIGGLRPRLIWGRPGDVPLDRAAVLRYLGYRPGRTRMTPRAAAAVAEGIAAALRVIAPRAALCDCAVARVDGEGVTLAAGVVWRSRRLARAWAGARVVTLVAATLGEGIDETVRDLFRAQEYAVATVVDAAGSSLIHGWLQAVAARVAERCRGAGLTLSDPCSPGYGDWDLGDQHRILELTGAGRIGLESTPACYLVPSKSVVAALAWLDAGRRPVKLLGCAACGLRDCRYRQVPVP